MPCRTPHDFCEMACNSGRGSFPAPTMSRSITNLGIALSSGLAVRACTTHDLCKVEVCASGCLEAKALASRLRARNVRDRCPVSTRARQPAVHPEARVAGPNDRLVTMLNADLVENPRDVIANRFFRETERAGNLRIVEALGDSIKDSALAWGEVIERQLIAGKSGRRGGFGEKPPHLT